MPQGRSPTEIIAVIVFVAVSSTATWFPRPVVMKTKKGDQWVDLPLDEFRDTVRWFSTGLRLLGVKPGDRFGILSENRPEWTMADFATRSIGIGYTGGSLLLFALVLISLAVWYRSEGTVSVQTVSTPRVEWFYWITITFSQTLGTALGDWVAAPPGDVPPGFGFGYEIGAVISGGALAIVLALYLWTRISHVLLFWAAFILTRPLGGFLEQGDEGAELQLQCREPGHFRRDPGIAEDAVDIAVKPLDLGDDTGRRRSQDRRPRRSLRVDR